MMERDEEDLLEQRFKESIQEAIEGLLPASVDLHYPVALACALGEHQFHAEGYTQCASPLALKQAHLALQNIHPRYREMFAALAVYLDPEEFARAAGLTSQEVPTIR